MAFVVRINAQEPGNETGKNNIRDISEIMREQIIKLREGSLLVRLQAKQNAIDALIKSGQTEKAAKYKVEQENYNKKIISVFKIIYSFSPVYFFFSEYTDAVQMKQFDKVVFVNDSLNPDTTIKMKNEKFLVGEFGYLSQDTAKMFSNYYYENSVNGPIKKTEYHGGADWGFKVFKLMSDQFVQLAKPFPYYVKSTGSFTKPGKIAKVIRTLDENLYKYYKLNK
jgi:hypothetical protein